MNISASHSTKSVGGSTSPCRRSDTARLSLHTVAVLCATDTFYKSSYNKDIPKSLNMVDRGESFIPPHDQSKTNGRETSK